MMLKFNWTYLILCVIFTLTGCSVTPENVNSVPPENSIVANLKLHYPQLVDADVKISPLTSTAIDGLRIGRINVDGQRSQAFLIGTNNKIYLLASDPIEIQNMATVEQQLKQHQQAEEQRLAEQKQQLADIVKGLPFKGNPGAEHILVKFSDFQCPYCAEAADTIDELVAKHGNQFRFVILDYPLDSIHPWARQASIAAMCAAEQSNAAYWTLHDFYFEKQELIAENNLLPESRLQLANQDLNLEQWQTCAEDTSGKSHLAAVEKVNRAVTLGNTLGVDSTPTFFFNGQMVNSMPTREVLESLIVNAQTNNKEP